MTEQELINNLMEVAQQRKSKVKFVFSNGLAIESDTTRCLNEQEYHIIDKAYIALDLDKCVFANMIFDNLQLIIDNENKWDFMIAAREHYLEELQYDRDLTRIEEMQTELRKLNDRKECYEKKRRCYRLPSENYIEQLPMFNVR